MTRSTTRTAPGTSTAAAGLPEQRDPVKLLRCPQALPDRGWLQNTVLWADQLCAIWPEQDPTPKNATEEQRWADIELLRDAKELFRPIRLTTNSREFADKLLGVPPEVLDGERTPWSEQNLPLLGAGPEDDPGLRMPIEDTQFFLYPDKLPSSVTQKLVDRKLLVQASNEFGHRGYFAAHAGLVPWLMIAFAEHLHEVTNGVLLPAPSSVAAQRGLLEPKRRAATSLGCMLQVPGLPIVSANAKIEELLEVRSNDAFAQAREEYLTELQLLWQETKAGADAHGGSAHDPQVLLGFIAERAQALQKAQEAYSKKLRRHAVLTAGLAAASAMITLVGALNVDQVGVQAMLEGGVVGLEGVVALTPLLARRKAPDFVRIAGPVLSGQIGSTGYLP